MKKTRTQVHHRKAHETPGSLKLFTNEERVFVAVLGKVHLTQFFSLAIKGETLKHTQKESAKFLSF